MGRWKAVMAALASAVVFASCGQRKAAGIESDAQGTAAQAVQEETTADGPVSPVHENTQSTLSVPTQITKIGGEYFIVDCYHSQILYHDTLGDPLENWSVLTDSDASGYDRGHMAASDGEVIVADDTENDRVLVFASRDGGWQMVQTFEGIGNKPHCTEYDSEHGVFLVWSAYSGQMYVFQRSENDASPVSFSGVITFTPLENTYVRTFTIEEDTLWFVSGVPTSQDGLHEILSYDYENLITEALGLFQEGEENLVVSGDSSLADASYAVPDAVAGMVQMEKIGAKWYITVSTDLSGSQDAATILRTDSLESLEAGDYEDIYAEYFEGGGTPYYLGEIDGHWYLTEHRLTDHAIWQFDVDESGEITDVKSIY